MKQKIILAYSGGLDTSIILKWLVDKNYEVICYIADVGQKEDFEEVKKKAINIGASKVYISDLKKEFVEKYIFQALKANAKYEGKYLLGTSLSRPLIAKNQVLIAQQEKTNLIAHGATGKGNDQVRFELAALKLMPNAEIISHSKDKKFLKQFKGRNDLIQYAMDKGIPITSTLKKPYSIDENLMHTSYESGILENPCKKAEEDMYKKTTSPFSAPDKETKIVVEFKEGIPIKIHNKTTNENITGSLELFEYLNEIGSKNGIGRADLVENRFIGMKSRGVYETPAGTILWIAHLDLESLTLDKEVSHLKNKLIPDIAKLIYDGFWFSPEFEFLMAGVNISQRNVEGKVHISLYKGNVIITGRESSKSLYDGNIASMNKEGGFDQTDAKGFIKIQALRLKIGAKNEIMG